MKRTFPMRLAKSTSIMACSFVALGDLPCWTSFAWLSPVRKLYSQGQRPCRIESHLRSNGQGSTAAKHTRRYERAFSFLFFSFLHPFCVATATSYGILHAQACGVLGTLVVPHNGRC